MTAYAHAFVQASGAIETSLLNSAASNISIIPRSESSPVVGLETVLKYRITYVPGILVSGLIGITFCAAIVIGLTAAAWGSVSLQSMRLVDGLRFVIDFAGTMKADDSLVEVSTWSRERLVRWADGTSLRYVLERKGEEIETSGRTIRLMNTTRDS
jgi:hypothetical protein